MARQPFGRVVGRPRATFNEVTKSAAKLAQKAAIVTTESFERKYAYDEDDVTGHFVGSLNTLFHGTQIGGINLAASIVRHKSGKAAEESKIGADILIHVSMDTPTQTYSKGVLIQAKKAEAEYDWSNRKRKLLTDQCEKMLAVTAASFVFNYSKRGIRCGAATRVAGATTAFSVEYLCGWSAYRFFLELFRCPIGDPRISSAAVSGLPETQVPFVLELKLKGELDVDPGSSL